jgi:PAS domain S-box-containing protein
LKPRSAKRTSVARVGDTAELRVRLREAEERLRALEERHELAMGAIRESVYDWDIANGGFSVSNSMQAMLGLPAELLSLEAWHERIHPDDFARFRKATIAHLKGSTERFECDYRYRAGDGACRWARTHGIALRNAEGRAVRMVGSTGDITELKRAEEALRASEERYALATAAAVEGIYEWKIPEGELYLTDRAKSFFAFPDDALSPGAWNKRVHAEDYPRYREAIVEHFKGETPHLELEYRIADGAGGYKWVLDRGMAVRDSRGRAIKMVGAVSDITARKRTELELRRARDEATEALEQQTATAEILQTMSRSLTDLAPVFDTILRNTIRLCEGDVAALWRFDGRYLRFAAHRGGSEQGTAYLREHPLELGDYNPTPQAGLERRPVHVLDVFAEPRYRPLVPAGMFNTVPNSGTVLAIPLLREDKLLGVITIWRHEKRMFNAKQVAMVNTFAAQAVIAIENVRLFNETNEALERQTATAEILKVIASSPSDVQPVFDAVVKQAGRLAGGCSVNVSRLVGEHLHLAAYTPVSAAADEILKNAFPVHIDDVRTIAEAVRKKTSFFVSDFETDPHVSPRSRELMRARGFRSTLYVPILQGNVVHGLMHVSKVEPGPFSPHWIQLLETFADQVVIAIENVRLFNETKEALERQTATAEILRAISSTPTDTQPVFAAIVQSALRVFSGTGVGIALVQGDRIRIVSAGGTLGPMATRVDMPLGDASTTGAAIVHRTVVNTRDTEAPDAPMYARDNGRALGFRSIAAAPMLREGAAIGAIGVTLGDVGGLSDRHLDLLKTFADQAVIAIENVRLFNETREALERQTATSEILTSISRSMSNAQPVFDAIAHNVTRFLGTSYAVVQLVRDGMIQMAAFQGYAGFERIAESFPRPVDERSLSGLVVRSREVFQLTPIRGNPRAPALTEQNARDFGYDSIIVAPMLRGDQVIGVIATAHREAVPFDEKHVELIKSFAAQAVIAVENARLFNETKEALEQQQASAEVLRVMSSSVADTKPVFQAILESCERLFEGRYIGIALAGEDGNLHLTAYRGPHAAEVRAHFPVPVSMDSAGGAAILTRSVQHYADIRDGLDVPAYARRAAEITGHRSVLMAPMLWEGSGIGTIYVCRDVPGAFSEKEIGLLKTFADQAVIAIQNARLFSETKEALEQQQASGEVLRVIGGSIADAAPVFEKILESCQRLFQGYLVGLNMVGDDGQVHIRAYQGPKKPEMEQIYPLPLTRDSGTGCAILDRTVVHYPDIEAPGVPDGVRTGARVLGFKSIVFAPLLAEGQGIGALWVARLPAGAFGDKQISLLKSFADQAVIAIQNARLFNETKEALERQTATSEVLKVISQTRIDLQPVLETVLDNARRLCDADRVLILRPDGKGSFVPVAVRISNEASTNVDALTERPIQLDRSTAMGRALLERRAVHIPDVLADPDYTRRDLAFSGGFRTALSVPMLREGEPIGAMTLTRAGPPRPFTQKQIELVTTFADQAVIAIENVRLFNETTEALEQLGASAEILRVISSSVADVQPVFDTILESCERLFAGRYIGICLVGDDRMIHLTAYHGLRADELKAHFPVPLSMDSAGGAAILTRSVQHYPDLPHEPGAPEYARKAAEVTGYRSVIMAPMLWEGQGIGTIFVARETAGAFTDKEIALLTTFADQAVIAIQNARLFREINEKSRQLEVANRHKSEFLANMSHELRTPLNAIIGFTRIVMRRSKEQLEPKQYENLEKILSSGQHLLQLINAILDLAKVEAGRVEVTAAEVALAPVLEQCVKTVEPLVRAPAVRLLRDFDGALPQLYQDEEKLRQIVINLLSNAVKFTERGTVRVRAKANGESFAVAVADTGIGIPADKLEHVFDEFAQADASSTRVYGGTGLGLTIARRLARLLGGDISVESAPGAGSTFTLTLPVRYRA